MGRYVDQRVLLLIFPQLTDFGDYSLDHLHADASESVRGLEVDVVDLLDTFRRFDPEELKVSSKDVTHPNAFANGLVVDEIAEYLMGRSDTSHWFE